MRQEFRPSYDEMQVQRILADAGEGRPMTRGQFDRLTRPYLEAGYAREVAEAERQYFRRASQHAA